VDIYLVMKKTMLIIGGSGFLGINWLHYNNKYRIVSTYNTNRLNFTADWKRFSFDDKNGLNALEKLVLEVNPEVIVNCSAIANIEKCESQFVLAKNINTDLPRALAVVSEKIGCRLIHISTDHYFSELKSPRNEFSNMFPVNNYGITKMNAEKTILGGSSQTTIVRVNFFGYGLPKNPSLLDKIIQDLDKGKKFYGFDDVFFNPVSIEELVSSIELIIENQFVGLIHLGSNEVISKYEFARRIAKIYGYPQELILPRHSTDFDRRVKRPQYLALDATKFLELTQKSLPLIDDMLYCLSREIDWKNMLRGVSYE